ncbi:hypothetical protein ACT4R9_10465 [Ornithobacterium rhinotracheale]|uniref:hypothetical protein n=1 Tax=Ornithobacterium rhinotracheale TaxID=28251 RepID=UPI003FA49618
MKNEKFYKEVIRLSEKKNLSKRYLICPICGDLLDATKSSFLQRCSCKSLGIDSNGTDEIERIIINVSEEKDKL